MSLLHFNNEMIILRLCLRLYMFATKTGISHSINKKEPGQLHSYG
jgi:hypothetical protein